MWYSVLPDGLPQEEDRRERTNKEKVGRQGRGEGAGGCENGGRVIDERRQGCEGGGRGELPERDPGGRGGATCEGFGRERGSYL
jgi:hypothetical protein